MKLRILAFICALCLAGPLAAEFASRNAHNACLLMRSDSARSTATDARESFMQYLSLPSNLREDKDKDKDSDPLDNLLVYVYCSIAETIWDRAASQFEDATLFLPDEEFGDLDKKQWRRLVNWLRGAGYETSNAEYESGPLDNGHEIRIRWYAPSDTQ